MSILEKLNGDIKNLPKLLEPYKISLEEAEKDLSIKGKRLESANSEQAALHSYYDERRIELHTLCKYIEAQVAKTKGMLWKRFTETYSRELGPRDKEQYINKEEEYLVMFEIYLEVHEIYKKYDSVVDAFQARGYALRNITNLRVGSLEDVVI